MEAIQKKFEDELAKFQKTQTGKYTINKSNQHICLEVFFFRFKQTYFSAANTRIPTY